MESKKDTGFTCEIRLFLYRVMLFRLMNAPSVFQRLMDTLILPFERETVDAYLDDILKRKHALDKMKKLVIWVMEHLIKNDMNSLIKKYSFYVTEVEGLGHVVNGTKKNLRLKNRTRYQTTDTHIQIKSCDISYVQQTTPGTSFTDIQKKYNR
jgi:hypothetical protein